MLWQCTTCGACENQCPVGIEHLPLIIGARRGLVSNGDAPDYLGGDVQQPRAPRQHLGPGLRPAPEVRRLGGARDLRSGEARRARLARLRRRVRGRLPEVAAIAVRDPAGAGRSRSASCRRSAAPAIRRSGPATSTCSRSWRTRTSRICKAAGPKKILTSCPHCVKTIGDDYRKFGYEVEIVHSAVFVEELTRDLRAAAGDGGGTVTYHDPCYLGRYAGKVDEPRALLARFGAEVAEPERNRDNPYCCGAGGGLLFADKEEEPGSRISDVRFKQLQADRREHRRDRLSVLLDHAEGRAGQRAGQRRRSVRRPDDVRQRPADEAIGRVDGDRDRRSSAIRTGARRGRSGCRRRLIAAVGYRADRGARRDAALARPKASSTSTRSSRGGRQPIMAFWHGRILPATYLLPPPRHRRHHQRELRRRVDRRHHRAVRLRHGARLDVARRPQGAAAAEARHGGRQAGRLHGRRPARSGARRAAGRRLAGEGDRQSGPAVSHRGHRHWTLNSWDRTQIPKPFATVAIAIGEPFDVSAEAGESELEAARKNLEERLAGLEERARRLLDS